VTPEEPALEIPAALLERLPAEVRERIPADWRAAMKERSAAAVDWRWAANRTSDEDLRPLSQEREGYRPGRRRKLPAPEGRELTLCGYDGEGRTVIASERDGIGADDVHGLFWHEEAESLVLLVQAARGPWPARLLALWRSRNDNGRPVRIEHFGEYGRSVERCRWDGERLVEASVDYPGKDGPLGYRDVLVWQGTTLVRIERHWSEGGTICALALGYTHGERSLPPYLVACPEAVRRRLLEEHGDDWYRWHAAEWMSAADVPELVGYGGPAFNERCEQVDRQMRLGGDERAAGPLLQAVARRLNALDWGGLLDVTPDFLVYPWEVHGESLEADIAASAPPPEASQT
jgi:hypothetical protein